MRIEIISVDGSKFTVHNMEDSDVLNLVDEFGDPDVELLMFGLGDDGDEGLVYLLRRNIVRLDTYPA